MIVFTHPLCKTRQSLRKKETFCQIVRDVIFSYVIFSRGGSECEGCYLPEYKGGNFNPNPLNCGSPLQDS